MKKLFFVIVMLLTISFNANSQDKIIKKNTATERAPVNTFGTDNQNPNTIQSYGSRWFGQNAGASSFFAKGFLNSAAAVNNFGPSSADLYGAMEFNNTGVLYCIAVAAGSPLQTLDTVTGALTPLGSITGIGSEQVLGMSFDPKVTNLLF